jgi:hypothetical protein
LGRTNIAVSDEIAAELSQQAEKDGKTAFALANECLGASLRICASGGTPEEIYGAWKMNRIGKDIGALQWVGRSLMERFVREFAPLDPDKFAKMWQDAGFNFGVYMQICFPTIEDVASLVVQLRQSFNVGRVDFVEGPKEPRDGSREYTLNVVTSYSAEFLTYISAYWRGILSAYGLDLGESNIAYGVVRLRFHSSGKLLKMNSEVIA